MADKEERILIRKISICNDTRTKELDWQQCKCCVRQNGHCEYHPQSKETMPYKKTVKKVAKKLEYEGINKFECHSIAKWCLEALLEK